MIPNSERWSIPRLLNLGSGIIVIIALLVFPIVVPAATVSLGFVALQYAIMALGLNMVVGWMGLLDLGAAGFVAIGAYVSAILMTQFGWPPLAAVPAAMLAGFVAGILLGIPTLRHREDYFAILTLGFAELVALTIRNWPSVTRGSFGYSGIPATTLPLLNEPLRAFPPVGFYYFAAAVLVPCFLAVTWLRTTSLGRRFHLIKHSETVAQCYGINVTAIKIIGFGLSAMLLATGGFFWAAYQRAIVWTEFGILLSCLLLSLVIVGGEGNPRGVILGAAVIGTSQEILRRVLTAYGLPQDIRFLVFAFGLILFVHFRSRGILPDRPRWSRAEPGKSDFVDNESRESPPSSIQPSTSPLLEIRNVSKRFGGIQALDKVSLEIGQAECVALIGPNGSGKSTLLNVVAGLLRPDEGIIAFNGKRLDNLSAYRVARLGIRKSFQEISVFDDLSVRDNVVVTSRFVTAFGVRQFADALSLPSGDAPTNGLSYGQKKSLDLARVFADLTNIRLVLLDEPTAGLTKQESFQIVDYLRRVREKARIATVVVSHDMRFLDALIVDRVVVLNSGRIFRQGSFAEVRGDSEVATLFWGDKRTLQ